MILIETGQSGISDKSTLVFLINIMLHNGEANKAIEVAALAINRSGSDPALVRDTFTELILHIADKKQICGILDSLTCTSDSNLETFEEVLRTHPDQQFLVLFLIYTNRLAEANQAYAGYLADSHSNVPLIELLLRGRENAMPAAMKFLQPAPDLSRLHYPDARGCNKPNQA